MKSVQLLYTTNMSHDITLSVIQSSLWIMIGQLKFNWFVWACLGIAYDVIHRSQLHWSTGHRGKGQFQIWSSGPPGPPGPPGHLIL